MMSTPDVTPYRWVILALTYFMSFITAGWIWLVLPVFLPQIGEQLQLSPASTQFIFGSISLALIGANFLGGVLGVRYSLRWVVGGGGLLMGVSAVLRGLFPNYPVMIVASILYGLGFGLAAPNYISALAHWFPPQELGFTNGFRISGVNIGAAIGQGIVAGYLLRRFGGWEEAQMILGLFGLGMSLIWIVLYHEPGSPDDGSSGDRSLQPGEGMSMLQLFWRIFSVKDMVFLALVMLCVFTSAQSFIGILPTWLEYFEFVGDAEIGFYSSMVFWSSFVGSLILPYVSDRIGRRKAVSYGAAALALAGVIGTGLAPSGPVVLVTTAMGGMGGGAMFPVLLSVPGEHPEVGPELSGMAVGLLYSVGQIGGAVGPPLSGIALEQGGLPASIFCVAFPYAMALLSLGFLRETGRAAR